MDLVDDRSEEAAFFGEGIDDPGRDLGEGLFVQEAVGGELAQALGEDLGGDALDVALKGSRAVDALLDGLEDRDGPFAADDLLEALVVAAGGA